MTIFLIISLFSLKRGLTKNASLIVINYSIEAYPYGRVRLYIPGKVNWWRKSEVYAIHRLIDRSRLKDNIVPKDGDVFSTE
jgi:hypothetical protein